MPTKTQPISPPPPKRRRLSGPTSTPAPPRREPSIRPPAPNHLRIYSWNIDGIAPFLQRPITSFFKKDPDPKTNNNGTEKDIENSLRECLKRWKWPELVCLQEVKIRHDDEATKRAVEKAVNNTRNVDGKDGCDDDDGGPGYMVRFCLPRDGFDARGCAGRVYGVATLIRDDLMAREVRGVREVDWDGEGRVLVTELESGGLVVVNVYAVNGTDNPWRDPQTGVVLGTRHERKLRFHEGLVREWRKWEREGRGVVVVGDLNVARGKRDGWPGVRMGEKHVRSRRDFERKFFEGGNGEGVSSGEEGVSAVDAFREVHGGERRYSYYPRGRVWGESCDRVDLGMVSRGLVLEGKLVGADILDSEGERGPSDHVPLYVTLKLEKDNGTVS